MPLIIMSQPVNFTYSGIGTVANPYVVTSTNHYGNSSSEIMFFVTEDGVISPNLNVSSEQDYDFGILINNETYIIASGDMVITTPDPNSTISFTDPFAVFVGDIIKIQFTKNELYSYGADNITGTITFKANPRYASISRLFIAGGNNQHINLFVQNDGVEKTADLFLKNMPSRRFNLITKSDINNNVQLITKGSEKETFAKAFYLNGKLQDNVSLNIKSEVENNLNLYITCAETASEQLYFNLKSQPENSITLFINNIPTPSLNNYLDLNIHSSTNDSIFNGLNLYILSLEKGLVDLFVLVDDIGITNESVNLHTIGDILFESNKEQINLFLQNSYLSEYGEMPITIIGLGSLFNSTPYAEGVNLYIEREMHGIWDNIPLVVVGNLSDYSNAELITYGKDSSQETFNLNMPETKELVTNETHLYVHGYTEE